MKTHFHEEETPLNIDELCQDVQIVAPERLLSAAVRTMAVVVPAIAIK